jgi:hypothetical protein
MRISAVFQVQFPQARFVSVDTDVATQALFAVMCKVDLGSAYGFTYVGDKSKSPVLQHQKRELFY